MRSPFTGLGRARVIALAALSVSVVAVAATHVPVAVVAVPDLPGRDLRSWTMPLDRFAEVPAVRADYAEALLVERCLGARGEHGYAVPWRDVDAATAAATVDGSPPEVDLVPLSVATAAERGYALPNTVDAAAGAWLDFGRSASVAKIPQATLTSCAHEVRRSVPRTDGPSDAASQLAARLTSSAAAAARQDPRVVSTLSAWRSCLVGRSSSAVAALVPEDPHALAVVGASPSFRSVVGGTAGRSAPEAEAEAERTVAEADAACQVTSGYRSALYDAEWSRLARLRPSDLRVLEASTQDQRDLRARVDAVIARYAPRRPSS